MFKMNSYFGSENFNFNFFSAFVFKVQFQMSLTDNFDQKIDFNVINSTKFYFQSCPKASHSNPLQERNAPHNILYTIFPVRPEQYKKNKIYIRFQMKVLIYFSIFDLVKSHISFEKLKTCNAFVSFSFFRILVVFLLPKVFLIFILLVL